jgi:riboflavin biosynthesis pyrimidine reductase
MPQIKTALIRASVSLDGKLLTASGKPLRRVIPAARVREASELELTIHPVIMGNDRVPTLSGLPGAFLAGDLRWELLSVAARSSGTIAVRYRRKIRARKASRPSRAGS